MKRDMDLVRAILIFMSENDRGPNIKWKDALPDYTPEQILHHAHLMVQGGLIEATDATDMSSLLPMARPISITWDGHEFLDGIKDPGDWERIKKNVIRPVGGVVFSVLKDYIKMELKAKIGIP